MTEESQLHAAQRRKVKVCFASSRTGWYESLARPHPASRSFSFSVNRRHPSRVADVTSLAADKPEATAGRMPFWL